MQRMMVQVKADGVMSAMLGPLKGRAEIIDERGVLIGYYEPVVDEQEEALYRRAMALFDPKEVEASLSQGDAGSTIDEILRRLRATEGA